MNLPVALVLALLVVPAPSPAQTTPHNPVPVADPASITPAASYSSVLTQVPRGVVQDSQDWKDTNAQVSRFPRGHSDILKWEQAQGGAATTLPAAAPTAVPAVPMLRH